MHLLARARGFFDRTLNVFAYLAAGLIALVMLTTCYEVVMRYFFNRPTLWVVETNEHLLLYIAFLPVAWLLRERVHVRMDMLVARLKPRPQAVLNILISIICAVTFLVVTCYGVQVTWQDFVERVYQPSVLEIPNAYVLAIIPIGSFLLFIQFLRCIPGHVGSWKACREKEQKVQVNS